MVINWSNSYRVFQLLQDRHARRYPITDQHRRLEVPRSEHLRDVAEVHLNLFAALGILPVLCFYFD